MPFSRMMTWAAAATLAVRPEQSGRYAHSSPSEAMKTPSIPFSRARMIQLGRIPLLHGTAIVVAVAG